MAAIGLLDIPPEIQLQIAELVETRQTLKALSVTSRSLRSIAQSMLFESLQIDLGKELRGSVDDLLANPRICSAIRCLELRGRSLFSVKPPRNDEEKLSLIKKILPEMVGLRRVSIYQVNLSKTFLDTFLGIAANMPLQINLAGNIYPYDVIPTAYTPLQISHFGFGAIVDHQPEFYPSLLHAATTTLTELSMRADGDGLMKLAEINLPFLHNFTLMIPTENEVARTSAAVFITAQKAIRMLDLRGKVCPFPQIPPDALPNLRELRASTKLVDQLVPGRPVRELEVSSQGRDQDWFGEGVGKSTVRVRMLRVHLNTAIIDTRMVKRMVTILPHLKHLWLPVFDDALLNVVEVLTSLKHLKTLRFNLFRREVWVDHDINSVATKLRNANSSFSFLEIREGGARGWINSICVWNEVFGVFHHMKSASAW